MDGGWVRRWGCARVIAHPTSVDTLCSNSLLKLVVFYNPIVSQLNLPAAVTRRQGLSKSARAVLLQELGAQIRIRRKKHKRRISVVTTF